MKPRGRYGVDAAYVPALMVLGGCVMSAFAALQSQWSSRWSWLGGKVLREQGLGPRFWYGGPWAAAKLLVLERP